MKFPALKKLRGLVPLWLLLFSLSAVATPSGLVATWGGHVLPYAMSGTIFTNVTAGLDTSFAIQQNGTLVAWGNNFFSQVNITAGLSNVVAVAPSSSGYALVLLADGTVRGLGVTNS